jgi:transposase InsO family protein
MDATEDGRRVKVMPVVDEYTRECLSLEGQRSIKAEGIIDTLSRLSAERGAPDYLRSDNGPEFIAAAVKEWLAVSGVKTLYVEPGSPWENVYSETFVSRLRDELLERELFVTLKEAQVLLEDCRQHYNQQRPHGALGYLTPVEFAAAEDQQGQSSGPAEQLESVQRLSS